MGWWSDVYKKQAEDWIYEHLDPSQVPEPTTNGDVPLETYLKITLRSMRIVNIRKVFTKFYGMVHSFAALSHETGEAATFQTVVSPTNLKDIDVANVDRVISVNHPLMGPVPYRGEGVELELGLFSIASTNLAGPYIDLLTKITELAGVSFVTAAKPFVEPLKIGMSLLTGTPNSSTLEIGISTKGLPKTGWWVAMRAPKGNFDMSHLKITPNDYRLVDRNGNLVSDYPYLVFSIEATDRREDFYMIPSLKDSFVKLMADARRGNFRETEVSLSVFKRAALTCPDLVFRDAERIAEQVEARIKAIMAGTRTAITSDGTMPELKDFSPYEDGQEDKD